jgi:hypothetical protein
VTVKNIIPRNMTQRDLGRAYRNYGGTCGLHLQGERLWKFMDIP